ncbi:MAG: cysteine desulfurase family protein [Methyloprofundus sp.]|nr:cysteine desulfurase family protein [Methyloprofundus sp.]
MIYFDHNATTALDDRVLEEMLPFLGQLYGNPSGLYRLARISRSAIETARERIALLINANPEHIIFTSGGTEANNLALKSGLLKRHLITSKIEHPSILESCPNHVSNTTRVGVDYNGLISEQEIVDSSDFDFASFMLVNNETGVIQEVKKIAQIVKERGVLVHTDAVQALGKIKIDMQDLGVDLMSISSHKIYGPKGCGALISNQSGLMNALMTGGGQEKDLRAGTENVAAIVGFGKAAELARLELEERQAHSLKLRNYLEQQLQGIHAIKIFSGQAQRISNTVQIGIQGCVGEMLLMQLDQQNIAVSSGSACASNEEASSYVLAAMAIEPQLAQSAIRVSLGKNNTLEEIDIFVQKLKQIIATNR